MTWLNLIDELKKQPLYLLEREVSVWCNIGNDTRAQVDYLEKPLAELTTPYNDSGINDWLSNPDYHLSIVIDFDSSDALRIAKTLA